MLMEVVAHRSAQVGHQKDDEAYEPQWSFTIWLPICWWECLVCQVT